MTAVPSTRVPSVFFFFILVAFWQPAACCSSSSETSRGIPVVTIFLVRTGPVKPLGDVLML